MERHLSHQWSGRSSAQSSSPSFLKSALRTAAVAAVAALGLLGGAGAARAGGWSVDVRIGGEAPPPVVVREAVVVDVVGFRRNLYDADLRLRLAQCDQVRAHEDLESARRREGGIAADLEDAEAVEADLRRQIGGADAALAAARAAAARAADDAASLRERVGAYERRLADARGDLDASRFLRDEVGVIDATRRIRENEVLLARASADRHAVEARLADLREAEARCADLAAVRARLSEAQARCSRLRDELFAAHEAVVACQARLTDAGEAVCLAVHDRDESLWLIYKDDLILGRVEPAAIGFSIDLRLYGGRMPRDPGVLHACFVRDVGYWRERPVEVQTRIVEVDRVKEVTKIREVQRVKEVTRIREVEQVEARVTVEHRRAIAQHVTVERQRLEAERGERKTAAAEGRKPRVMYVEKPASRTTNVKNVTNVTNVTNVRTERTDRSEHPAREQTNPTNITRGVSPSVPNGREANPTNVTRGASASPATSGKSERDERRERAERREARDGRGRGRDGQASVAEPDRR